MPSSDDEWTPLDEAAWWAFYAPRASVQWLARRLPLARVRDLLPAMISSRVRLGLYPARVQQRRAVECACRHPAWGDPATLDPALPIAYAAPPRASVLVVTHDNLALTRLCFASLQRSNTRLPFEIIAIDNASTDGTPAWLAQAEGSRLLPLRVIANAENVGFAAANNQAARLARGDLLVFLNNDTVVTPGWLDRLCAHLDADPTIGLIGPSTNSCGNEAEVEAPYVEVAALWDFAEERARRHRGQIEDLPMLALYCAVMSRALYESVGGLDERYRVGMFEDDDLATAVLRVGRRVVCTRDVYIHHYGGAAFLALPASRYLRIWWENRRRYERKWGVRWQAR